MNGPSLRDSVAAGLPWPLPGRDESAARAEDRATAIDLLTRWLEQVRTWNRKIDLTAARDDEDLVELGLLDAAMVAARVLPAGGRLVDVGTGFGAPGLAVAILRPDLQVVLVEPLGKRATFLRATVSALGLLERVEIAETRGEALAAEGRTFDAAISRATLSPSEWLALGDRLAPHGDVVVLLAREEPPSHLSRSAAFRVEYATRKGAPRVAVAMRPVTPP